MTGAALRLRHTGRELASPLTTFLPYRPNGFYKASLFCGITAMANTAIKIVSKDAGRIFLPFRLHTILPAFAVLFNFNDRPVFPGGFILTYFSQVINLPLRYLPGSFSQASTTTPDRTKTMPVSVHRLKVS